MATIVPVDTPTLGDRGYVAYDGEVVTGGLALAPRTVATDLPLVAAGPVADVT